MPNMYRNVLNTIGGVLSHTPYAPFVTAAKAVPKVVGMFQGSNTPTRNSPATAQLNAIQNPSPTTQGTAGGGGSWGSSSGNGTGGGGGGSWGATTTVSRPAEPPAPSAGQVAASTTPPSTTASKPAEPPPTTTPAPVDAPRSPELQAQLDAMNAETYAKSSTPYFNPATGKYEAAPSSPSNQGGGSTITAAGDNANVGGGNTPYVSPYQAQVEALRKQLAGTYAPTSEEQALQQQYTDLVGNANLGISALEGQGRGIPLGLVRGQQGQLEEQANYKAQTLQEQLANMIANRTAQQQGLTAQLGFAQNDLTSDLARTSPTTVGDSILQFDPTTGTYKTLYSAPGEAPAPIKVGAGETLIDPTTGQSIYSAPTTENQPATVQEYIFAQQNGYTGSFLDYQKEKSQMSGSGSDAWQGSGTSSAGRPKDSKYLTDAGKLADDYSQNPVIKNFATEQQGLQYASNFDVNQNNPSSDQALIFSFMKVLDPTSVVREGEYATAQNNAGVLNSFGIKLQNVIDGKVLNAAQRTSIINAMKSKYGSDQQAYNNVVGQYTQRAQAFGIDPEDVITSYNVSGGFDANSPGSQMPAKTSDNGYYTKLLTGRSKADGSTISPQEAQQIEQYVHEMEQQQYSEEAIRTALNGYLGFNSVPSTTQNGSAQDIANAIKKVESGGNYNARGGSGENGAYQFMPATWSQWAGQYLGNANAPMTPENQDRVATAKIQDWINQGYNPQQIALMWNGGTPTVKKGTNKYGVAYDSGAYAQKVLNALG